MTAVVSGLAAHAAAGFQGFDLFALGVSASAPFVVAGWWLARRLRRVGAPRYMMRIGA